MGSFFGIIPVPAIGGNGFVLGVVFRLAADTMGYAEGSVCILPHGPLEIPALLISAAYGLWIGVNALRRVRKMESVRIGNQLRYALRRFLVIVFLLSSSLLESRRRSSSCNRIPYKEAGGRIK
jgi:uncharacterized membrane protein SpoIIM required for sporulation